MRRRRRLVLLGSLAAISLLIPASAAAQSNGSMQPRIVGGSAASISQYPWQAAVVFDPSEGGNAHQRQFCGGSLLTSRIVITAGHCVFDTDPDCGVSSISTCIPHDPGGDGTTRIDPNDVDVVLGRTTLSDTSQGAEIGVMAVKYQANYDPNYQGHGVPRYDVGYLVLNSASAQNQIKIAGTDEAALWDVGSPVEISGWGTTSELASNTQDTLRAATVNIVSDSTCNADYAPDFDSSTMVCAAAPGTDTCYGDSGGPLEASVGGGVYRLVGITGWGDGCARANAPGVYTRVAGPTMASLIQSDVSSLQATYGLLAEPIFGATPSSPSSSAFTATNHPYAKCKRIRDKKKRRRCIKKVRRKLKSQG